MKKKGYSKEDIFGNINHYDENGKKLVEVSQGCLADIIITMRTGARQDVANSDCLEITIIMTRTVEERDIHIGASLIL